jgi:hypothetical protein
MLKLLSLRVESFFSSANKAYFLVVKTMAKGKNKKAETVSKAKPKPTPSKKKGKRK